MYTGNLNLKPEDPPVRAATQAGSACRRSNQPEIDSESERPAAASGSGADSESESLQWPGP